MSGGGAPTDRHLLVYGLGRSGLAVVQRAHAEGASLSFFEARAEGADVEAALGLGAERVQDVNRWLAARQAPPLVVAAPGVPIDHPDLATLRAAGVEVIGEVEWVWRGVPGRYVGITGTAGKGSVTRWCGDTLQAAGEPVVVGGNIEPALAAVARPGATHVVEMSSFQLERCPTFAPEVAVVLNLGEDHIDRHGSVANYHAAKKNLLANLRVGHTLVVNQDDAVLASWGDEQAARGVKVRRFSLRGAGHAHLTQDGWLNLDGAALLHRNELKVRGYHQVANALATALVAEALGVARPALLAGLRAFEGLPGRYAPAGQVGGVRFVEDSIATRPLAVAAALTATPRPLVWLAGGQGKGADVSHLRELVAEHVDLLLAFGQSGPDFEAAYGDLTRVERVSEPTGEATMRALVTRATAYLREHHGGSGHVLLAPLATSFDQFADYKARGAAFRAAVAELASATLVGAEPIDRRGEPLAPRSAGREGSA